MAQNKTTENKNSVTAFIAGIKSETKRNDCSELVRLLKKHIRKEPKMWGPSIIGFGSHHYVYESGREGDSPDFGFSPRASSIALYLSTGLADREALLKKLGKYKGETGCIHIKTLSDIDQTILLKLVDNHIKHMKSLYPDK